MFNHCLVFKKEEEKSRIMKLLKNVFFGMSKIGKNNPEFGREIHFLHFVSNGRTAVRQSDRWTT